MQTDEAVSVIPEKTADGFGVNPEGLNHKDFRQPGSAEKGREGHRTGRGGISMDRFYLMVEASNRRFPEGVQPYQMAARLLEECGEVAAEINLWEGSGLKRQKHGEPKKEDLANEIRQAMVELVKIARYYHVEKELEQSIERSLERSRAEGLIG